MRGRDLSRFPARIETGIRLHRHLDRFTDTHPALKAARQRISQVPLRFSGIVMDVMFDHYLACRWNRFSDDSLDRHARFVHQALAMHEQYLPDSLQRFMVVLERERILQGNVHLHAIELTLKRIAAKSDKLAILQIDTTELAGLRDIFVEPFDDFYPDLQLAANNFLAESQESAS